MSVERVVIPEANALTADERWEAVLIRDAAYDGEFVFAVRSTGIYCRPSCPARRPRREQVSFFPTPEEAEREGYRECNRCRPKEQDAKARMVQQACHYIEANIDRLVTLDELGKALNAGPYHLQRTFKSVMGISPRQYADARRLNRFKTRVAERGDVTGSIYDAGYGSSSRVYEQAPSRLGMTPATYGKGGRGMSIHYTIVDSSLGRLLVGATGKGVCAVSLGDSDSELEAALREEYPAAEIAREESGMGEWVRAVLSRIQGEHPNSNLPLDIQSTAFQRRVWQELLSIPYGDTRTYGEVARGLGEPKAARAVAYACATNPVCIVVPCHRVVRTDGNLAGYRWGVERKRALLQTERASLASRSTLPSE